MQYLNIYIPDLRSPEFIGSSPSERATWLCVLAYCADQENGGRIDDCADWKDRQWQQTCGVTAREVRAARRLLIFDETGLNAVGYPIDKEEEVQSKREAGRRGGMAKSERNHKKTVAEDVAQLQAQSVAVLGGSLQADGKLCSYGKERKGKEGKGMAQSATELPFSSDEFAEAWATWEQHRKEKKQKITPTARRQQLKALASLGEREAIRNILHSVANGYTGIFAPKPGQIVEERPKLNYAEANPDAPTMQEFVNRGMRAQWEAAVQDPETPQEQRESAIFLLANTPEL